MGNNGRFAPFFPVDNSVVSFPNGGLIEGEVDAPFSIMMAFDVNSNVMRGPFNMEAYDVGTVIYLAYKNTGPLHLRQRLLLVDTSDGASDCRASEEGQPRQPEGIRVAVRADPGRHAGLPFKITTVNTLAAL